MLNSARSAFQIFSGNVKLNGARFRITTYFIPKITRKYAKHAWMAKFWCWRTHSLDSCSGNTGEVIISTKRRTFIFGAARTCSCVTIWDTSKSLKPPRGKPNSKIFLKGMKTQTFPNNHPITTNQPTTPSWNIFGFWMGAKIYRFNTFCKRWGLRNLCNRDACGTASGGRVLSVWLVQNVDSAMKVMVWHLSATVCN